MSVCAFVWAHVLEPAQLFLLSFLPVRPKSLFARSSTESAAAAPAAAAAAATPRPKKDPSDRFRSYSYSYSMIIGYVFPPFFVLPGDSESSLARFTAARASQRMNATFLESGAHDFF